MLLELSKRLENITFDGLPVKTVEKTKTAILNFVGGSLPGAGATVTFAEKALWESQGMSGDCVVIGHKGKTVPLAAAAINASMGQVFLQEDCHEKSISHPGVVVIPAVLALAQAMGASGRQVIEAVVAGYEGQGKIGRCLIIPGFPKNGLRPASYVGPFGAACGVAKLLRLDAEGIRGAISIAGNTSSGVMEFSISGTDDICIQNCYNAKSGMMSAIEAKNGLRGAPTILEGRFGLGFALNNKECDWSVLTEEGGYEIDDTFVKIYPGCGHVLPTAQAAMALVKKYSIRPEDVRRVVVGTREGGKSFPGCDNPGPFTGTISAMMSHQYMVAAAIVTGNVDIAAIKRFADPGINAMAAKVTVEVDEEVCALPESGGRLTIELGDGRTVSDLQEETVPLTAEGVAGRMRANGKGYYSDARMSEIMDKFSRLEELSDINELMNLLEADI